MGSVQTLCIAVPMFPGMRPVTAEHRLRGSVQNKCKWHLKPYGCCGLRATNGLGKRHSGVPTPLGGAFVVQLEQLFQEFGIRHRCGPAIGSEDGFI